MSADPGRRPAAEPPHVVVIGGGIAGLLAARRHARSGARVTLVESADRVGGAVASAEVAGLELNTGAEAYSVASGAVDELVAELGLADHVVSPVAGRGSRLVSDAGSLPSPRGGLLGIPTRPLDPAVRRVLGWPGALRAALDRALPVGSGPADGVSIGAYVRRRMGRRVLERLVAPVVGGVHSADPMTLELAAIQPRLPAAVREAGSLAGGVALLKARSGGESGARERAGAGSRSTPPRGSSPGTAVHSLTPTMALLPRALEAQLRATGARILTGEHTTALRREGAEWRVVLGGTHPDLAADHLVLATGPEVAAALLAQAAPQVAAAIPSAPASPVLLVALVVESAELDAAPSGTGALVAPGTRGIRAKALTHASGKWEHVRTAAAALGPHTHVVRLSYGRPGEALPPDAPETVDLALRDAARILGVPLHRKDLRGARIITWPDAMRGRAPGHREALDALARLLVSDPAAQSLELVGSWRDGTGLDAIASAARRTERATSEPVREPVPAPEPEPAPIAGPPSPPSSALPEPRVRTDLIDPTGPTGHPVVPEGHRP